MNVSKIRLLAVLSAVTVLGACAAPVSKGVSTGVYKPATTAHSHTHSHTHTTSTSVHRVTPAALPRCQPHGTRYHVSSSYGGSYTCHVFHYPASATAHSALMYRDSHGRSFFRDGDGYWRRAPAHDHH